MAKKIVKEVAKKEEKKDFVLVQFIKCFTPYIKGEIAGFDERQADKFVKLGVAEYFKK